MVDIPSVSELERTVDTLLEQGNLDLCLRLVHDFVVHIVTEPLCTAQVYGSATLDRLCQRIGLAALPVGFAPVGEHANCTGNVLYVYIVTRLQNSGGHRQVIFDFISARPYASHLILSTELAGSSDAEYLMSALADADRIRFEAAPPISYVLRLKWLQHRLLVLSPNRTYLFNHHQDSVAVAAIHPSMKLSASFYHHGDHHLCLGVYLDHMTHIDPHPMGYFNCRKSLHLENKYVPLVSTDKGIRTEVGPWQGDGYLVTCTAARSNKVEIPYFIQYVDLIPELLACTKGRHIHIGRLSPWARWRINLNLKRCGVSNERFVYIPWVGSVWEALLTHRVDVYIASFPYGGALTLIEAMGAGVPVALHRHISSRLLSCVDMAYPEAFSWRSKDELLSYFRSLSTVSLVTASLAARAYYEKFHQPTALGRALGVDGDEGIDPPMPAVAFSPALDEWGAWVVSQVSFHRWVARRVFRVIKRLQARWA